MKKMLLIIDPQVDFITGSLPVPGAEPAMDALARFIKAHGRDYAAIVITADWHPWRHFSFASEGGPWPRHCVQHSAGAAVWAPVLEAACETCPMTEVLTKGLEKGREEYSIFQNAQSAQRIAELVRDLGINQIDLCGLAGDVCVKSTLEQGAAIYGPSMFRVLTQFAPSLDGGAALSQAIASL